MNVIECWCRSTRAAYRLLAPLPWLTGRLSPLSCYHPWLHCLSSPVSSHPSLLTKLPPCCHLWLHCLAPPYSSHPAHSFLPLPCYHLPYLTHLNSTCSSHPYPPPWQPVSSTLLTCATNLSTLPLVPIFSHLLDQSPRTLLSPSLHPCYHQPP